MVMLDDELDLESLEDVNTGIKVLLDDFYNSYTEKYFERVIELGNKLLSNPALNDDLKDEINKMVVSARDEMSKSNVNSIRM